MACYVVTIIEIQTYEAVIDLTNLIFTFSLWRALTCIQTAEVTELSVSFFCIAFCIELAGDLLGSFLCCSAVLI